MQASIDWLSRRGAPDLSQDQGDFELASALDRRICVVLYAHKKECAVYSYSITALIGTQLPLLLVLSKL
jgi:hypothetical protein